MRSDCPEMLYKIEGTKIWNREKERQKGGCERVGKKRMKGNYMTEWRERKGVGGRELETKRNKEEYRKWGKYHLLYITERKVINMSHAKI